MMNKISYGSSGKLQLPDETYKMLTGDCDDQALFMAHILEEKLNKEAFIYTGTYEDALHGWVYCEGIQYEATAGGRIITSGVAEKYVLHRAYSYKIYLTEAIKLNT